MVNKRHNKVVLIEILKEYANNNDEELHVACNDLSVDDRIALINLKNGRGNKADKP